MPKLTKTMEEWMEKFDSDFDHYNPKNDDGEHIPTWSGSDYDGIKKLLTQAMQAAYAEGGEDAIEEAAKIYNPYIEEHNPESNICPCCVFDEVIQSIQSLKQPKE